MEEKEKQDLRVTKEEQELVKFAVDQFYEEMCKHPEITGDIWVLTFWSMILSCYGMAKIKPESFDQECEGMKVRYRIALDQLNQLMSESNESNSDWNVNE